jgi:hypothetical protein
MKKEDVQIVFTSFYQLLKTEKKIFIKNLGNKKNLVKGLEKTIEWFSDSENLKNYNLNSYEI